MSCGTACPCQLSYMMDTQGSKRDPISSEKAWLDFAVRCLSREAVCKGKGQETVWSSKCKPSWWDSVVCFPWKNPTANPKDTKEVLVVKYNALNKQLRAEGRFPHELEEEAALWEKGKYKELFLQTSLSSLTGKVTGLHAAVMEINSKADEMNAQVNQNLLKEIKSCLGASLQAIENLTTKSCQRSLKRPHPDTTGKENVKTTGKKCRAMGGLNTSQHSVSKIVPILPKEHAHTPIDTQDQSKQIVAQLQKVLKMRKNLVAIKNVNPSGGAKLANLQSRCSDSGLPSPSFTQSVPYNSAIIGGSPPPPVPVNSDQVTMTTGPDGFSTSPNNSVAGNLCHLNREDFLVISSLDFLNSPESCLVTEPCLPLANSPESCLITEPCLPLANSPESCLVTEPCLPLANSPESCLVTETCLPLANSPESCLVTEPCLPLANSETCLPLANSAEGNYHEGSNSLNGKPKSLDQQVSILTYDLIDHPERSQNYLLDSLVDDEGIDSHENSPSEVSVLSDPCSPFQADRAASCRSTPSQESDSGEQSDSGCTSDVSIVDSVLSLEEQNQIWNSDEVNLDFSVDLWDFVNDM